MRAFASLALAATIGVAAMAGSAEKAEATDWGAAIAGFAIGALVAPHITQGHVYYGPPPPRVYHRAPRRHFQHGYGQNAHVQWCSWRYRTYNPYTNLYFYRPGRQRHCISPYS